MKFTTTVYLLAGVAAASPFPAPTQSKPFELVLSSQDTSVNGKKVSTCHAGAAIEAACIAAEGSTFYFNTTTGAQAPIKGNSAPGNLIYNLPISNGPPESSGLNLFGDAATNVQEAIFEPGNGPYTALVTFSDQGYLGRISYLDDTVTPPTGITPEVYTNWYICETYYTSYTYQTLAWTVGNASQKPQNPSCIKVDVVRKYL